MPTKRALARQLDDLQERFQRAVDARDEAREQTTSDQFAIRLLSGQLDDARKKLDALEHEPAVEQPLPTTSMRDVRRALMLSERARRSLAEQCATLQAANEAMCNERADGAPTWEVAPR